jgi:hypothetical protein
LIFTPDTGTPSPDTGVIIMAGRGPAPKDPKTRARRNKPATPAKTVTAPARKVPQPPLPRLTVNKMIDGTDVQVEYEWPERTKAWWEMWGASPLSKDFIANDWSELLDTARLHAQFWSGDSKVAAELRLRVAKFGATPEDRARLRIDLTPPEPSGGKKPTSSRSRFGDLRVVEGGRSSATG